jgi:Galactose oxidase, central domain
MSNWQRTLAAVGLIGLGLLTGCGGGGGGGPAPTFAIGGLISGLTADGLTLTNGNDTVSPASGATSFQFSTKLANAASYAVTATKSPPALTCTVSHGSGVIDQAAPTNIAVTCVPVQYVLGGSISGLTADGLVLENGNDSVSVASGATSFEFATKLLNGSNYSVTVSQAPPALLCSVSNGTGSINLASPTNISVTCVAREWTWKSGSSTANPPIVSASQGVPSLTPPSARRDAVSWTDSAGNFWVFGGESPYAAGTGYPNDLWRYNPVSSEWTLIRSTLAGGVAVYGTLGVASPGNVPGGRHWASSWMDLSGDLWLFGGIGYDAAGMWGLLNDLWRYHPATSEWTWISGSQNAYGLSVYGPLGVATASAVPGARDKGVTFTDAAGDLWLFGGFGDQPDGHSRGDLAEMWKFSIASGEWTLVSGDGTVNAPSVYGTLGVASASNTPGGRIFDVVWQTAPGEVVMYGGESYEGYRSDLWKYSNATGDWTWINGATTAAVQNSYGVLGQDNATNTPGARTGSVSWADLKGNLWMFGGYSDGTSLGLHLYNDLWEFRASTQHWVWISGSSSPNAAGTYGTLGTPALANVPGARSNASAWADTAGRLWLFGGGGYDGVGGLGYLNDVWVIQSN